MIHLLLQIDALTDFHRAVRDQFRRGGSTIAFLLALIVLILVIVLVYLLSEWQRRRREHAPRGKMGAHSVFEQVMEKLKIGEREREWLVSVAHDSKLKNPAVLLIAENQFTEAAEGVASSLSPEEIESLRKTLFPGKQSTTKVGD